MLAYFGTYSILSLDRAEPFVKKTSGSKQPSYLCQRLNFSSNKAAGPISWKAARQGGVTLSSSEAEFVAASQAGKEVLYLRALLKGLACPQTQPTDRWEDNASCILMSENPTKGERSSC